jgi:hypothetical protein
LGERRAVDDACVFLASPMARWITGHDLVVDGGMSVVPPHSSVRLGALPARRADLVDRYPDARMRIEELTRSVSRSAAPGCSGR